MNLKQKANNNKKEQVFDYIFKYLGKDIMNYQSDNFDGLITIILDKFKVSKQESLYFIKQFRSLNPVTATLLKNFDSLYTDVLNYENLLKSKKINIDEKFFEALIKKIITSEYNSQGYIKATFFYLYFAYKYDFEGDDKIDIQAVKL